MRFLPARITVVPNHSLYSLSRETGAEPRQVKKPTALPISHQFHCHQWYSAAHTALAGKGNSHNSLKILVPLWSEMECWNCTSMQQHLNIAVAGVA